MIFLTEEQVRERCGSDGKLHLGPTERLTPAAGEFLRGHNCKVVEDGPGACGCAAKETPAPEAPAAAPQEPAREAATPPADAGRNVEHTYLDAQTVVSKSHPRIFLRGRLDTLIAETVLTQTSLAAASRIPDAIKNGLADINAWLWQILQAEVSGSPVPEQTMCGMNAAVLREVARDPQTYLNQGHIMPDPSLGPCVAAGAHSGSGSCGGAGEYRAAGSSGVAQRREQRRICAHASYCCGRIRPRNLPGRQLWEALSTASANAVNARASSSFPMRKTCVSSVPRPDCCARI